MVVLPGLAPPDDGAHPADGLSGDADDASSDTNGLLKARDSGRAI